MAPADEYEDGKTLKGIGTRASKSRLPALVILPGILSSFHYVIKTTRKENPSC